MSEERILLTIPEAAMRLGLGRSFVYGLVMSGELKSIKLGRARRVPSSALQELIEQRLQAEGAEEVPFD